jgi:hypothetical protein
MSELQQKLTAALEREVQATFDEGLYIIYTNELCVTEDLHIHEFKDGKKQLVRTDAETGVETIERELA